MFVRVKKGGTKKSPHQYVQILESYRDKGKSKHRLIANLGRLHDFRESGDLDSLIRSFIRLSDQIRVISEHKESAPESCTSKIWGPVLIFERLWKEQKLPEILKKLNHGRKFRFDIERAVFALALQRLCEPGSDLQGYEWLKTVEASGFEKFDLHHLYRTCSFLNDVRQELEQELFWQNRDLFNQELDLVFIDTTSTYVYRDTETNYRKRGYSRDKRPDLPQFVICVAVDKNSWPISWEIFPGNTTDKKAFAAMVSKFRQRFRIGRITVVADRGMISKDMIRELEEHAAAPYDYILGCKMRKQKVVRDEVLSRAGRFSQVRDNLEVKEVSADGRRYIICRNPEEARRDKAARTVIVEKLERALASGAKNLIRNTGYRRFLKTGKKMLNIDYDAVKNDERYDGKYVLTTNTDLPADEVACQYKSLWRVERTFREEKSTLEVRPIFHKTDENSIGHIVASFLALRLEVDLQKRMEKKGTSVSWPTMMRDLKQMQAVHIKLNNISYKIRTDFSGDAHLAFKAAGVKPPQRVVKV